ncbi:class I SAM-dependent methyltransferase [Nonlabens ulvanivorans]|uniref:class I SAM-dependent methyltransferase n=1 Tax=Nonlabens ulvanivorans TaxID=906888 RepID=UPI0029435B50|nr:class I SAM-dependent methyltransferase [Nonlabens ulvanivorans]WOI23061.1 class I SAM-dependent methyltransferase [Nonlabens ulvanivorans]
MDLQEAFEINKNTWNQKTAIHFESEFYDKDAFAKAKNSLNSYELNALGNVKDKKLLHLQCHFGQDSLSWAHKGAVVTGVDISDEAIKLARKLSVDLGIPAQFVCCNVLETSNYIKEKFDIIFTSYGTIGWLPDLKPWAQMISERLNDNGVFYIVDFHPIAWMYDYNVTPPVMKYHYAREEAIYDEYEGTYANNKSKMVSKEYGWNHSLSEVVQSLIDAGLSVNLLAEHDGSPYDVFPNMKLRDDGLYYLDGGLYPMLFEISAVKA